MSLHTKDSASFQEARDTFRPSRFEGMPLGIELAAKWVVKDWNFVHEWDRPGSTTSGWTATVVGTGTNALSDDLVPPRLVMANSAADNDSIENQYTDTAGAGEFLAMRAGKRAYFKAVFSLDDANDNAATVTECDMFLGLATSDTTSMAGNANYVGFYKPDGSTVVRFVAGRTSTVFGDQLTSNVLTLTAAANAGTTEAKLATLEFVLNGANEATIYVNGSFHSKVRSTTQFPTVNLCPTLIIQNGEAVIKQMHVAQLLVALER